MLSQKKTFSCFINENFEEAAPLMQEGKRLRARLASVKSAKDSELMAKLEQVLYYAKEISMFVR